MRAVRAAGISVGVLLIVLAQGGLAQRAPGAPTPPEIQMRIGLVQAQLRSAEDAQARVAGELRQLEAQIDRLRVEERRLASETARLQGELQLLLQQAR